MTLLPLRAYCLRMTPGNVTTLAETSPGTHIRTARENLNISRAELAAVSGFSRTYIYRLETGTRNGTPATFTLLANHLGAIAAERLGKAAS